MSRCPHCLRGALINEGDRTVCISCGHVARDVPGLLNTMISNATSEHEPGGTSDYGPKQVPLAERPDFLRGSIDALQEIERVFDEHFVDVMNGPGSTNIREFLSAQKDSMVPLHVFAAALDHGAFALEGAIDSAIAQARWKLERVQRAQAPGPARSAERSADGGTR